MLCQHIVQLEFELRPALIEQPPELFRRGRTVLFYERVRILRGSAEKLRVRSVYSLG